jgi:tetratricopeptide (TPR) repeat protein
MPEDQIDRFGTKDEALANARRLLGPDPQNAAMQAREVLDGDPGCAPAHRILGMALRRLGRADEARKSEESAIQLASVEPKLFEAAMALAENRLDDAERVLRPYLSENPDDAAALRMLAEIAARLRRFDAAQEYLQTCLVIAPDYRDAQRLLSAIRRRAPGPAQSGASVRGTIGVDELVDEDGATVTTTYESALGLYERAIDIFPHSHMNWLSYGHVLRTVGRQDEAAAAYRRAIVERPAFGEAWWALADLKTRQFVDADMTEMQRLLDGREAAEDRIPLHFALAKALEQKGAFQQSFEHYAAGNALQRQTDHHDRHAVSRHVDKTIALLDLNYFDQRHGAGFHTREPIFVLGLPRAGSTLLEQILSTHPLVEGTMELPDIPRLANMLGEGCSAGFEDSTYLDKLVSLDADELKRLGQSYIWSTGLRRTTDRPRFVDKMPNNWLHVGLILSILPNAKIIDARRHPLGCGFSNFKQHFARGQAFTYDLTDVGQFYADYARSMQHFDRVMPGRVCRLIYERLIEDPEQELRRVFEYLELDFDPACLRFYENKRAVRTASSEQVRRPINKEGVDQWRNFDPWLGELRQALGPIVDAYPDVPDELA